MKQALYLDTLRKLTRAKGRFLSLFGILAISSGFFSGLKVTSDDMKATAERYYTDTKLADLHLQSTVGFCAEELALLAEMDGIAAVCGGYSEVDYLAGTAANADTIVKVYGIDVAAVADGNTLNLPVLTEGRLPQTATECVIEVNTPKSYQLGDTLTVQSADADNTFLAETEYTIVGRADWSLYVDFQRGTTTIGNGSIDSFLIVPNAAFETRDDLWTDVYLSLSDTQGVDSFSKQYQALVDAYTTRITDAKETLSAPRVAALLAEAETTLQETRDKLDTGWADVRTQRTQAQAALAEAKQTLDKAKENLAEGTATWNTGNAAYEAALASYQTNKQTLDARAETLAAKKLEASGALAQVETQIKALRRLQSIVGGYRGSALEAPFPADIQTLIDQSTQYDTAAFSLSSALTAYFQMPVDSARKEEQEQAILFYTENCATQLQDRLADANRASKQLAIGQQTLDAAQTELANGKLQLDRTKAELDASEADLQTAQTAYDDGVAALQAKEADTNRQLADAEQTLRDGEAALVSAQADLEAIDEQVVWYVQDRTANPGWSSFGLDADRVNAIAKVFPIFFLLVAALVCLTTMTRMVEEQRTELGAYQALGYAKKDLSMQFLLYAGLASVLGVAVGTVIGFQVFPRVVFLCYQMMYHYPPVICHYHWGYAAGCLVAALLCTGLTAMLACRTDLREVPAMLMRPRPPQSGKRVLLERWTWLWKRLSFHAKVTIRNFCRYKKRVLMTVLGICGCTALLLTGFGLSHAISAIVDLQFQEVFQYDLLALFTEGTDTETSLRQSLASEPAIVDAQFAMRKSGTIRANGKGYEADFIVPEAPETFSDFVCLRDRKTHAPFALTDEGVLINEKLAKLLSVSIGDSVTLGDANGAVLVTGIVENYALNYVYFTPACYRACYGDYQNNTLYATEQAGADEDALAIFMLAQDGVLGLSFSSQGGSSFRELIGSLNYVVLLIICSSGLLAFVVLYNLANINITERIRELATIKVLGFYDGEVAAYIYRENVLSACLGMICGLFVGVWLCRYVVQTAEVDVVMFCPDLPLHCFVFAGLLTVLFTVLVNALLYWKLKAIEMAGSLKAIE